MITGNVWQLHCCCDQLSSLSSLSSMWCPGPAHIQRNHIPTVQAEAKKLCFTRCVSELVADLSYNKIKDGLPGHQMSIMLLFAAPQLTSIPVRIGLALMKAGKQTHDV